MLNGLIKNAISNSTDTVLLALHKRVKTLRMFNKTIDQLLTGYG